MFCKKTKEEGAKLLPLTFCVGVELDLL